MCHHPDLKIYYETTIIKINFFMEKERKKAELNKIECRHKFKTNENKVSDKSGISKQ